MPSADQLAEMARQMEELQKQQTAMQPPKLRLPRQDANKDQSTKPSQKKADETPADSSQIVAPGDAPEVQALEAKVLALLKPNSSADGHTNAESRFAYTTHRPVSNRRVAGEKGSSKAPIAEKYPLVVKTRGDWFEARLVRKTDKKQWFLRPNGDLVGLPANKVERIIAQPVQWPLSR